MSSNTSEFFLKFIKRNIRIFFCFSPSENDKNLIPKVPRILYVVEYLRIFLKFIFGKKPSVFFGLSPSENEKKLIQKFR